MANRKPKTVSFRRKREQKTNYTKRLYLLMSRQARLVVRLTNTKIIAQLVTSTSSGDVVVVAVDSGRLVKLGWNYSGKNIPAAYLTGLLLAKLALKKGVKEGILDTGFRYPILLVKSMQFSKELLMGGLKFLTAQIFFLMLNGCREDMLLNMQRLFPAKKKYLPDALHNI